MRIMLICIFMAFVPPYSFNIHENGEYALDQAQRAKKWSAFLPKLDKLIRFKVAQAIETKADSEDLANEFREEYPSPVKGRGWSEGAKNARFIKAVCNGSLDGEINFEALANQLERKAPRSTEQNLQRLVIDNILRNSIEYLLYKADPANPSSPTALTNPAVVNYVSDLIKESSFYAINRSEAGSKIGNVICANRDTMRAILASKNTCTENQDALAALVEAGMIVSDLAPDKDRLESLQKIFSSDPYVISTIEHQYSNCPTLIRAAFGDDSNNLVAAKSETETMAVTKTAGSKSATSSNMVIEIAERCEEVLDNACPKLDERLVKELETVDPMKLATDASHSETREQLADYMRGICKAHKPDNTDPNASKLEYISTVLSLDPRFDDISSELRKILEPRSIDFAKEVEQASGEGAMFTEFRRRINLNDGISIQFLIPQRQAENPYMLISKDGQLVFSSRKLGKVIMQRARFEQWSEQKGPDLDDFKLAIQALAELKFDEDHKELATDQGNTKNLNIAASRISLSRLPEFVKAEHINNQKESSRAILEKHPSDTAALRDFVLSADAYKDAREIQSRVFAARKAIRGCGIHGDTTTKLLETASDMLMEDNYNGFNFDHFVNLVLETRASYGNLAGELCDEQYEALIDAEFNGIMTHIKPILTDEFNDTETNIKDLLKDRFRNIIIGHAYARNPDLDITESENTVNEALDEIIDLDKVKDDSSFVVFKLNELLDKVQAKT